VAITVFDVAALTIRSTFSHIHHETMPVRPDCTSRRCHQPSHHNFTNRPSRPNYASVADRQAKSRMHDPASMPLPLQYTHYLNGGHVDLCIMRCVRVCSLCASACVCRSSIHGLGVFVCETVNTGRMICEYVGQVIRTSLVDAREAEYRAKVGGKRFEDSQTQNK
jgi:hypothetical protein